MFLVLGSIVVLYLWPILTRLLACLIFRRSYSVPSGMTLLVWVLCILCFLLCHTLPYVFDGQTSQRTSKVTHACSSISFYEMLRDVYSWFHFGVLQAIRVPVHYLVDVFWSLRMAQDETYHVFLKSSFRFRPNWTLLARGLVWLLSTKRASLYFRLFCFFGGNMNGWSAINRDPVPRPVSVDDYCVSLSVWFLIKPVNGSYEFAILFSNKLLCWMQMQMRHVAGCCCTLQCRHLSVVPWDPPCRSGFYKSPLFVSLVHLLMPLWASRIAVLSGLYFGFVHISRYQKMVQLNNQMSWKEAALLAELCRMLRSFSICASHYLKGK